MQQTQVSVGVLRPTLIEYQGQRRQQPSIAARPMRLRSDAAGSLVCHRSKSASTQAAGPSLVHKRCFQQPLDVMEGPVSECQVLDHALLGRPVVAGRWSSTCIICHKGMVRARFWRSFPALCNAQRGQAMCARITEGKGAHDGSSSSLEASVQQAGGNNAAAI